MDYSTLQTIAVVCYMLSGGLLAVSVLIFFLMDMKTIIGRITGTTQRRALARMRSGGAVGKTGETVIDMSVLEKRGASGGLNNTQRRSRRTSKGLQGKSGRIPPTPTERPTPAPAPAPAPTQNTTPNYFGDPYPNKTPPTPVAPPPPPAPVREPVTVASGGGTMDLEQWQDMQAAEQGTGLLEDAADPGTGLLVEDDMVEPVPMTILDDIVFLHTENFIEI